MALNSLALPSFPEARTSLISCYSVALLTSEQFIMRKIGQNDREIYAFLPAKPLNFCTALLAASAMAPSQDR